MNLYLIDKSTYGLIFLFNYSSKSVIKESPIESNKKNYVHDSVITNSMFFAHQLVEDSCATHAILSIVLNIPFLKIGHCLEELKIFCKDLDPELKGEAISNMKDLADIHERYSDKEHDQTINNRKRKRRSKQTLNNEDCFHYISFVPINNILYELDGLEPYPISHGEIINDNWVKHAKEIIKNKIVANQIKPNQMDLSYSLMAIVDNKNQRLIQQKCTILAYNIDKLDAKYQDIKLQMANNPTSISSSQIESIKNDDIFEKCTITYLTDGYLSILDELIKNKSFDINNLREVLKNTYNQIIKQVTDESIRINNIKVNSIRKKFDYTNFILSYIDHLKKTSIIQPDHMA